MRWYVGGLAAAVLLTGLCSSPVPLTADVSAVASRSVAAGAAAQLVVKVTNTGPAIPQLGLVFRTADHWFENHRMTAMGGCTVAADQSAFNCGDLAESETKAYSFSGVAIAAGTFHYELALRELVHPFTYVNDHTDGPDVQTWDETVT
jgi:hypothetical protein